MNKLIGDVIQGLGGDTTLKAGIAYARLKRGLLDNIARGKRGETLEEVEERYEKEGRFSDFQKIVVKTLTGAFDSLDKDQLEGVPCIIIIPPVLTFNFLALAISFLFGYEIWIDLL